MKEKYELAKKQGLNWQALLIEDTETEIKILIKEEMLKQSSFKKINEKVVKIISSAIDELENKELKEVAKSSLLAYATRVYYYLERTFKSLNLARIWALNAVLRGQQTIQQTRIVNKMMAEEVNRGYARALPLDIYAKDYMKQVKDRLEYLSKVVAKDDYSEKVSLRNIAEMQVRAEEKEEKLKSLVDNGVNLVWIVPHANCSKRCEPWQGKLYSLDGTYGSIDGIKYQPLENAMDVYETTKSGKVYKNGCISGFNCFDEQTKVLTNNGWKYFKDLESDDFVYTLNTETKNSEWQKPINYFKKWHDGEMMKFGSETTDLVVTPDHNMLYFTERNKKLRFKKAEEISVYDSIYCGEEYDGGFENFKLGDRIIDGRLFCRLLGYYLGDGSIHSKNSIKITQTNNDEMWESLQGLPFRLWRCDSYILVRDKALTEFCEKLGRCNNKFIPQVVKMLNKECLIELLNGMIYTDGYKTKDTTINGYKRKPHKTIFTTSKQLCADYCEIALKCGYRPRVDLIKQKGKSITFKNGTYKLNYNCYVIHLNYNRVARYKTIKRIKYKGFVYCVEVPNHTLLVSRNGKIQWCGNCRHQLEPYKDGNEPTEIPAKVIDREREINDKQRYLERGVRAWKERAVLLKGIDNESYAFARKKAREWNSRYIQYSEANNVAYYPSRVDILN